MMITPFQRDLRTNVVPRREIIQAAGCGRTTVWRWQTGAAYPSRELAEDLIALWARHGRELDYNGIYQPSVEVPGDE